MPPYLYQAAKVVIDGHVLNIVDEVTSFWAQFRHTRAVLSEAETHMATACVHQTCSSRVCSSNVTLKVLRLASAFAFAQMLMSTRLPSAACIPAAPAP